MKQISSNKSSIFSIWLSWYLHFFFWVRDISCLFKSKTGPSHAQAAVCAWLMNGTCINNKMLCRCIGALCRLQYSLHMSACVFVYACACVCAPMCVSVCVIGEGGGSGSAPSSVLQHTPRQHCAFVPLAKCVYVVVLWNNVFSSVLTLLRPFPFVVKGKNREMSLDEKVECFLLSLPLSVSVSLSSCRSIRLHLVLHWDGDSQLTKYHPGGVLMWVCASRSSLHLKGGAHQQTDALLVSILRSPFRSIPYFMNDPFSQCLEDYTVYILYIISNILIKLI